MFGVLLALLLVLLAYYVPKWYAAGRGLPPGLPNLPLIGCIPWILGKRLYEEAICVDKSHGRPGVVAFRVNWRTIVFINSPSLARQVFLDASDATSDRPRRIMRNVVNPHNLGIVVADRPRWEVARRFSLRVLKEFGLGKSRVVDDLIGDQLGPLLGRFDAADGAAFSPDALLNRAVAGVICSLLFGHAPRQDDAEFDRYLEDLGEVLSCSFQLVLLFPWLRHLYRVPLITKLVPYNRVIEGYDRIHAFLAATIREHRAALSDTHAPSDFVEAYLSARDNPSSEPGLAGLEDEHLRYIVFDLLVAGTDTSSVTLRWGLLFLGRHQHVQQRMAEEMACAVGAAQIRFAHSADLPYTRAVANEVMRFGNVAGLSLPHTATRELQVGQYRVPAGCTLLLNIQAILRDEKLWRNPLEFDPRNFLDDDGGFKPSPDFVGFSMGRRACLGESMARNEVFVFLASIVQKFHVELELPRGHTYEQVLDGKLIGSIRAPGEFKVRLQRRG